MQAWKPKPAINPYARWQRKSKVMAAIMSSVEIQVWVEIKSRKSSALRSRNGLSCVNAFVRKTQYRQNRFTRNSMRDMFLWRFRVSLIAKISEYRLLYCSEKNRTFSVLKKVDSTWSNGTFPLVTEQILEGRQASTWDTNRRPPDFSQPQRHSEFQCIPLRSYKGQARNSLEFSQSPNGELNGTLWSYVQCVGDNKRENNPRNACA